MPEVSIFASAVRPMIWPELFKSLDGTSVAIEVVFAGNAGEYDVRSASYSHGNFPFTYIHTENIKPGQCYFLASQNCQGETLLYTADDAEYRGDIVGKAYKYWKSKNNKKLILSLQVKESGYQLEQGQFIDMNIHRFFGGGGNENNPLMAPIGLISREYFNELGGLDRRYCAGQWENDIVMRAYQDGATVEVFGDTESYVDLDHYGKSLKIGECKDNADFLNRPFASSYQHDRQVLEQSWSIVDQHALMDLLHQGIHAIPITAIKKISKVRLDRFEPYEDKDLLTKSQGYAGRWQ